MLRRSFIHFAVGGIALNVLAQRGAPTARIGLILPTSSTPSERHFLQALRELGYGEQGNLVIERRSAEGEFDRLPALAAELVRSKPDVIVAFLTQASVAAKHATTTIPIVMVFVSDPVASGLVGSLARPGGNITGTSGQVSAVIGKQLALIRELRPEATRVATLWNPANAIFQQESLREARAGARRLGMQLQLVEARTPADLKRALTTVAGMRPDALLILGEPLFIAHARLIGEVVMEHRILAVGGARRYAEAGALAVYTSDSAESGRRAASYVDKILKGAKPADLPIEMTSTFEFIVNLKTAKALGIAVPAAILARADELIQ
jgi:putative ABC transport system substrate-binding protein